MKWGSSCPCRSCHLRFRARKAKQGHLHVNFPHPQVRHGEDKSTHRTHHSTKQDLRFKKIFRRVCHAQRTGSAWHCLTFSVRGVCAPASRNYSAVVSAPSLSPGTLAIASTLEVSASSTNSDKAPPALVPSAASKSSAGTARPVQALRAIIARATPTFANGSTWWSLAK